MLLQFLATYERCEVVYFLAYQKGTLPLNSGHSTTTTSISLLLFVFSCCVVILT